MNAMKKRAAIILLGFVCCLAVSCGKTGRMEKPALPGGAALSSSTNGTFAEAFSSRQAGTSQQPETPQNPGNPQTPETSQQPEASQNTGNTQSPETSQIPETGSAEEIREIPFEKRALSYDKRTLPLVKDMIAVFEKKGSRGNAEIEALLAELVTADHDIGKLWKKIMDHWEYVSSDLTINQDALPDGLPKDDSLCILVPGFQLTPDGEMRTELIERLKLALRCSTQYPKARFLLTGGPTSVFYGENAGKVGPAEADVMADWLISNGVGAERIMKENRSMTTSENARLSAGILKNASPKVKYLAIVSSDYHIPTVSLLYYAQAERMLYETGERPFEIISNAGCSIDEQIENLTVFVQSEFLKEVMGVE